MPLLSYNSAQYSNSLKTVSHFKAIFEDLSKNGSLLGGKRKLTTTFKSLKEIMVLLRVRREQESSLEQGNSRGKSSEKNWFD